MPIEIRELVIRAVVGGAAVETGGGAAAGPDEAAPAAQRDAAEADAIVQECVRQVLRILARDKER